MTDKPFTRIGTPTSDTERFRMRARPAGRTLQPLDAPPALGLQRSVDLDADRPLHVDPVEDDVELGPALTFVRAHRGVDAHQAVALRMADDLVVEGFAHAVQALELVVARLPLGAGQGHEDALLPGPASSLVVGEATKGPEPDCLAPPRHPAAAQGVSQFVHQDGNETHAHPAEGEDEAVAVTNVEPSAEEKTECPEPRLHGDGNTEEGEAEHAGRLRGFPPESSMQSPVVCTGDGRRHR